MTSDEALRTFKQDYHRTLNEKDFGGLVEFLDFPFEVKAKGARLKLHTAADVVEAFSAAHRVHVLRGVARVHREVDFVHVTGLGEALLNVQETAINASEQPIVSWRTSYLVARPNGVWRLTHVNATNHDEAWERRGEKPLHAAAESSLC